MEMTINGEVHQVDVDEDTPLLWALRDELKLTGTKFGCGAGLCGACTIHINGNPARACLTPVSVAKGATITTIEGLSESGDHPLQQAWIKHNVPQCGYCQSGQLMSAAALLANNPNPTEQEIDNAMSGNLCRCGTYPRIKTAIKDAALAYPANGTYTEGTETKGSSTNG
ncbi:(2Fe-2S)-binding protein [Microbulbifer agarilyticus]|uniref:(2Fe-2S)-binding protein n=1 Tax=Microbulbifer agarilyticus TaxID=260552 RepID=A0A1Q2M4P3_9GAMM|nr:(2Fe-2S)-binding protein [Microbulbifer agarilyticus]AQQ67202.1 (2Fe-2S)-binding protein [Microbulbifer agarilyticus]